jgi:hypothetical protein
MSSSTQFSPSHARFVYWFSGLAPVATNVVTPLMVYARVRRQPLTALKRQEMVMQEMARQVVSGSIGLLTYFGGGHLTKSLIELFTGKNNDRIDESAKQTAMLVGGTLLSFIGYGFIRPLFSTDIILHWLGQRGEGKAPSLSKSSLSKVGKVSGRKIGILSAVFGGLLLTADLLNRSVNRARQKSSATARQTRQAPYNQVSQNFMGTPAASGNFRSWA